MSVFDKVRNRVGRRGLVLILLSSVFLLFGLKAIFMPLPFDEQLIVPYTLLPFWLRGVMWIGASLLGIFAATFKHGKNDALGFSALAVPPAIIGFSYLIAAFAPLTGLGPYNTHWVDALQWFIILTFLMVISGWAEVDRSVEVVRLVDNRED